MTHIRTDCFQLTNNIKLDQIKVFVTVAESKSFSEAAIRLQVSKSHLSKQIKDLELSLSVQLIQRTTRSMKLTQEGQVLLLKWKESLLNIEDSLKDLFDNSDEIKGNISINCVGGVIGEDIIGRIISEFTLKYPKVNIELDFSSNKIDIAKNRFDFVIRMGQLEDSELIVRRLGDIEICTVATSKYLSKSKKLSNPEDLKNHNCITGSIKKWTFVKNRKSSNEKEIFVSGNINCKSGRLIKHATLKSIGIGRLPKLYCREELKKKKLIPVFSEWNAKAIPISLLYLKSEFKPARIESFIQFIVKKFPEYSC
ncbi:hypothetical protein A9Q84_10665 [Halobacteriovorax marinus]|uniref:HTH lysR-type domain-containing protein n=1 Tax=Halobacteriovorax marinus TaxID=97084 RepID=A0A1Y5F7P0_9BACT|nr:hypothetical protein A9Q84_10665 [Halobacteriovorax marinus]